MTEAEDRQVKASSKNGAEDGLTLEELLDRVLSADEREFLFEVQRDVAARLASHELLLESLQKWNEERQRDGREPISSVLLNMVPTGPGDEEMPLLRESRSDATRRWKFRWRFHPSGARMAPSQAPPVMRPPTAAAGDSLPPPIGWEEDLSGIRAVVEMLERL